MTEVSFVEECAAPVEVAFAYLADYRNVLDYWHGMTSFEPVGNLDRGFGSTFRSETKIGPSTLKSTIRTVEWEENVRLAYRAVTGMDSATSFDLTPIDENRSRVAFRVEFQLPGGIAGKAMERTLMPFVNTAARKTAENLVRGIAARHAAGSAHD
ncbi:MAG: SRPBCC family protein [Actinophytocola sp.]|uniref:SRPBCC family protein n=1 Tax=Actinophytocola sp. TaxID=1872138 RepID=UPI003D6B3888